MKTVIIVTVFVVSFVMITFILEGVIKGLGEKNGPKY